MRFAVFADAGSLWDYRGPTYWTRPAKPSDADRVNIVRSSVGAGLIWNSPFGPLRFDFAYALTKEPYDRTQILPFRRRHPLLASPARRRRHWIAARFCGIHSALRRTAVPIVGSGCSFAANPHGRHDRAAVLQEPPSLTIAEIAALTRRGRATGAARTAPLGRGAARHRDARDLAFLDNPRYLDQIGIDASRRLSASRRVSSPRAPARSRGPAGSREPYRAFVAVARALFPHALRPSSLFAAAGIAPGAQRACDGAARERRHHRSRRRHRAAAPRSVPAP